MLLSDVLLSYGLETLAWTVDTDFQYCLCLLSVDSFFLNQ